MVMNESKVENTTTASFRPISDLASAATDQGALLKEGPKEEYRSEEV